MEQMIKVYKILIGKYYGKIPFRRQRNGCVNNIKMDLEETVWDWEFNSFD
jgi:hypothetical protein